MRKLTLIIIVLVSFPSVAFGAIAVDATSTSAVGTGTTTLTWTHTVGAGLSNSILVIGIGAADGTIVPTTPVTVKYGGTSSTQAVALRETGAGNYTAIYYLLNPPAGAASVQVIFATTTATTNLQAGAISLSGVNQATPTDGTGTSVATTVTLVTSVANDFIADVGSTGTTNSGRVNGVGGGQTKLIPTGSTSTQELSYIASTSTVGNVTTSFTTSGFAQQSHVNAAFQAAATPAATVTRRRANQVITLNW